MIYTFTFNHSFHTAGYILEEGKDNVKSSWPLWAGLHTCYNGSDKGRQWCESERILKNYPSSDCSLQFENMKVESLVIVDQHATVNLYLSLVLTARHALEIEWIGRTQRFNIKHFSINCLFAKRGKHLTHPEGCGEMSLWLKVFDFNSMFTMICLVTGAKS